MIAFPARSDIDGWSELGNPGWDWESLVPYYKKFHTFTPPTKEVSETLGLDYMDEKFQGDSGPVQTSFGDLHGPIESSWTSTLGKLNFKMMNDPLSGDSRGGQCNPATVDPKTKTRSHAGATYYNQAVSTRPNLHILTEALVEKIMLEKTKDLVSATGVMFTAKDGKTRFVNAKSEVILSAGSLKSPQLLELSGIGSAELLSSHGIDVLINNPRVGENLQDHITGHMSFEVADGIPSADSLADPNAFQAVMSLYNTAKAGPLAASIFTSAYLPILIPNEHYFAFILDKHLYSTSFVEFPGEKEQYGRIRSMLETYGDTSIQYSVAPFQMNVDKGDHTQEYLKPTSPGQYVTLMAALVHPFSRGSVHITSADPRQDPVIDPKYLSHPLDLDILGNHIEYMETIVKTEPFASLLKKDGRRIPETSLHDMETARKVAQQSISIFHPSSTCPMMPRKLGGVVDERLIVHGTRNLRIVDASIMPLIPRGNIMSSVYAIAEKASDMIKAERK